DISRSHAKSSAGNSLSPVSSHQGASIAQPSHPPATTNANFGSGAPVSLSSGRNNSAVSAGLSVKELKAEITVDTAMVKANWRKKAPVMPPKKAPGTNQ